MRSFANPFFTFAVKISLHKSLISTLIIVLATGVNLYSQTKLKDTVSINEVEVKAIKPKAEDKSLEPMQQITKIELDRTSGNTADGAVKTFSGVILKDYGGVGGIKTVMVRSLGANHTGVFVEVFSLAMLLAVRSI